MKRYNMKTRTLSIVAVSLLLVSAYAQADVGVAVGHHTWADDGFPVIGPGEQVSIFTCTGPFGNGPKAERCAVEKCLKASKVPANAKIEKFGRDTLTGRKCSTSGWSERRGHSIVILGPKGDNENIMSRAIGEPTRESCIEFIKSQGFPFDKANIVFDYFDPGF
jgi:hypothetical protein